jgi:UDP-GlcNAc:undecaprenyl-phosphate GlcNAc-1-phosphate transferase
MLILAILTVTALLITLAVTPVCCALCQRLGWVDRPDSRKAHCNPIPRTGGIAILLGYGAALGLLLLPFFQEARVDTLAVTKIWALLLAVAVAFATGLLDDILDLKPWMKLLGQVLAAGLACSAGVRVQHIAGHVFAGTWWDIPLTIFWLVGCANAFNLIDGLDGLAAGIGFFATATAFLSALLNGNTTLALATAPLLGALLGFLRYNMNPASIFMGDCGSNTVGFLLGCFGVIWSQKSATMLGMTAPLIALAIPLLDTTLSITRRFLRKQSIFGADRGHIHHRLLARGLTPRRVAYVLYASAGVLAGLSLLLSASHAEGLVLVVFCVLVGFAVNYLGYEEFNGARSLLFGGLFRRVLSANLSLHQLENAIRDARSVDECWRAVVTSGPTFGFREATLRIQDRELKACLTEVVPNECWNLSIPLNGVGHLNLIVPFNPSQPPTTIGLFATSLRTVLAPKLAEFETQLPQAAPTRLSPPSPAISES